MKELEGAEIFTAEGLPEQFRATIGKKFAEKGAVQCGFCSPGMVMRAKGLYNINKTPTRSEIIKAISPNLCRCTGYVKIVDAIEATFIELNGKKVENKYQFSFDRKIHTRNIRLLKQLWETETLLTICTLREWYMEPLNSATIREQKL